MVFDLGFPDYDRHVQQRPIGGKKGIKLSLKSQGGERVWSREGSLFDPEAANLLLMPAAGFRHRRKDESGRLRVAEKTLVLGE